MYIFIINHNYIKYITRANYKLQQNIEVAQSHKIKRDTIDIPAPRR
jgi:uncharacterized protein (DUF1919 family)